MSFTYFNSGTKVIAQAAAIDQVPQELAEAGCQRVLVLSSPSVERTEAYSKLVHGLDTKIVQHFHHIPNHSSDGLVERLATEAAQLNVDGIVAFGGGSVSDTAKAIAICLAEGLPLRRHASSFTPPETFFSPVLSRPKLPIFAIPVSASAAEVTPGLGIRSDETGQKLLFWDVKLCPRVIFLDPLVNLSVPARIMQETLMNALAHCVEGMYSRIKNSVSQGLALQGARLIAGAMREMAASPQSATVRMQALVGAHISGMVIANSRVGIHHAVCHSLGSVGGLSHGESNSIMLPHAMRFNGDVASAELTQIAVAITPAGWLSPPDVSAAIVEVERLQALCNVPRRLRDTILVQASLPAIASATLHDRGLYFNPRRVSSAEELELLLENAW